MICQSLVSGKKQEEKIKMSPAEIAHRVVKVKLTLR